MVIGVVTPIKGQVDAAERKWREDGFQPRVTWAAPHLHHEIETAADLMADPSLEIIVLDCMGHKIRPSLRSPRGAGTIAGGPGGRRIGGGIRQL